MNINTNKFEKFVNFGKPDSSWALSVRQKKMLIEKINSIFHFPISIFSDLRVSNSFHAMLLQTHSTPTDAESDWKFWMFDRAYDFSRIEIIWIFL